MKMNQLLLLAPFALIACGGAPKPVDSAATTSGGAVAAAPSGPVDPAFQKVMAAPAAKRGPASAPLAQGLKEVAGWFAAGAGGSGN